MTKRSVLLAVILFAALCSAAVSAPTTGLKMSEKDDWYGIYAMGIKLGYSNRSVTKSDRKDGSRYKIVDITSISTRSEADCIGIKEVKTTYIDKSFKPTYEMYTHTVSTASEKSYKTVEAVYSPHFITCIGKITCVDNENKNTTDAKTKKKIVIPKGVDLAALYKFERDGFIPTPGINYKTYSLDVVDSLTITKNVFNTRKKKKTTVKGTEVEALQIANNEGTIWMLDNGSVIKKELKSHEGLYLLIIKEPKENAVENALVYDFNLIKSSIAINTSIPQNNKISELTAKFQGLPSSSLINDPRQTTTYDPKTGIAEYHVTTEQFDATKSISLPVAPDCFKEYMSTSEGIEVNDEQIQKLSKQIVGNEKSAYKAALLITAWVHNNLTFTEEKNVEWSAIAVLKARAGVCRHAAVLFAALARAAGIPTRLVIGLASGGNSLCYHAWVECYVGEWVPFDPTWTTDNNVDASHIKIACSPSLDYRLFVVVPFLSNPKLKAEIVDFKELK